MAVDLLAGLAGVAELLAFLAMQALGVGVGRALFRQGLLVGGAHLGGSGGGGRRGGSGHGGLGRRGGGRRLGEGARRREKRDESEGGDLLLESLLKRDF